MKKILCLLLAATCCAALAQGRASIGYQNVADALAGLKARKDVSIHVRDGWTIIDDQAANVTWSFVPAGHPAYPALVKRALVVRDGKSGVAITQLCQAGKSACDRLATEYENMNKDLRAKAYSAQGVPLSDITVQRLGEDAYRLVLTSFTSKTASAGQQELMPKAKQLCGAKAANFGKYQFNLQESFKDGAKDQGHLSLTQEISCGEAIDAPAASSAGEAPFTASPAQIQRVEQLTKSYFDAKDQARYQAAYDLQSPAQKAVSPFAQWKERVAQFNAQAGAVRERTIKQITWYQNPPQTAPGVYAAVDVVSQFANLEIHCGYVAWHQQQDGSFLLVREEENSLDKTTARKLKPAELARVRMQFGCRG